MIFCYIILAPYADNRLRVIGPFGELDGCDENADKVASLGVLSH